MITFWGAQVTESLGRDVQKGQLPEVLQGLQQWWVPHNSDHSRLVIREAL